MAENQLLIGLKRRYAQTLGLIAAGQDRADDLAHLAAVIRMFAPDADLAAIAPVRPYKPHRARWSRTALRILRQANAPMRNREIARRVMAAHGVAYDDERTLISIETTVLAVLKRLEAQGLVIGAGEPRRWAIAG
jgi:hypothetical protein